MSGDDDGGREDPLDDLADAVDKRRADGEADDLLETAFAEMEVEDLDPAEVWAELEADQQPNGHAEIEEPETRVQHKRVCHSCEYFSTPPEMHCTHQGTEIREVVDTDHYEVLDCPVMVGEDFE